MGHNDHDMYVVRKQTISLLGGSISRYISLSVTTRDAHVKVSLKYIIAFN